MNNNRKKYIVLGVSAVFVALLAVIIFLSINKDENKNWVFKEMQIERIWAYAEGDTQTVAFIDTGISDKMYDQLSNKIVYKYNVIDDNYEVNDAHGHGTEMVSIVGNDDYLGVYGIAPKAKLIIIKAVSDEGKTNNDYLYKALKVAEDKGATIVSISLGGFKSDQKVIEQIESMVEKNITIASAAGDYGNKDLLFPAKIKNVVSVEALSENRSIWKNSNSSDESIIRIAGCNIDTISFDQYGKLEKVSLTGTSEACAVASGYIALVRDYYTKNNIDYNNEKILDILKKLNTKQDKKVDYLTPFKDQK